LPKMKTHKKSGITCSLKNLVGINTYRNYLPHYTLGSPSNGGDQFPENKFRSNLETKWVTFIKNKLLPHKPFAYLFIPIKPIVRLFLGDTRRIIRSGNWYGNDTIWRMILDLNKIILYGDANGRLKKERQRYYISIVDGIIAGEGEGPKAPDAKESNCIIAGINPVAVDSVCARFMGFDPIKIPSIYNSFKIKNYPIVNFNTSDICIYINDKIYYLNQMPSNLIIPFKPHFGWKDHIEFNYNE